MPRLKEKSQNNIDAAKLLLEESLYAPSVHCSYYSCLQLMKHLVAKKKNETYYELEQRITLTSSHNFFINEISGIIEEEDEDAAFNFSDDIDALKGLRKKADYQNYTIFEDKGRQAKEIADRLILQLEELL